MVYHLRHFENNYQIVASLGWVLAIGGVIALFVTPIPVGMYLLALGFLLIWWQLRGKRIAVDTSNKTIKAAGEVHPIHHPTSVFVNEVAVSQVVNSRGSSTTVKSYFYKGYLQDGEESRLISCNRSEQRDIQQLKQIADDLRVPFQKNYT